MVPVKLTLTDPWPGFQGLSIFQCVLCHKQCVVQ